MIKDVINLAITNLSCKRQLDIYQEIALSVFLSGERIQTLPREELIERVNMTSEYNNFRNNLTILSPDLNFIIGTRIDITLDNVTYNVLSNIEMLALKASNYKTGDTALEILLDSCTPNINSMIKTSMSKSLTFNEYICKNIEEFFTIIERDRESEDSEIIICKGQEALLFVNNESSDLYYIENLDLGTSVPELVDRKDMYEFLS